MTARQMHALRGMSPHAMPDTNWLAQHQPMAYAILVQMVTFNQTTTRQVHALRGMSPHAMPDTN